MFICEVYLIKSTQAKVTKYKAIAATSLVIANKDLLLSRK